MKLTNAAVTPVSEVRINRPGTTAEYVKVSQNVLERKPLLHSCSKSFRVRAVTSVWKVVNAVGLKAIVVAS